jgi:hypothetical protein
LSGLNKAASAFRVFLKIHHLPLTTKKPPHIAARFKSKPAEPFLRSVILIWEKYADFKRGEFYESSAFRFLIAGLNVAVLAYVGGAD